jgi:hypothetical protein
MEPLLDLAHKLRDSGDSNVSFIFFKHDIDNCINMNVCDLELIYEKYHAVLGDIAKVFILDSVHVCNARH